MSDLKKDLVYVTKKGRILVAYTEDRFGKFKKALFESGYRKATVAEIEAKFGKIEPVPDKPEPAEDKKEQIKEKDAKGKTDNTEKKK